MCKLILPMIKIISALIKMVSALIKIVSALIKIISALVKIVSALVRIKLHTRKAIPQLIQPGRILCCLNEAEAFTFSIW